MVLLMALLLKAVLSFSILSSKGKVDMVVHLPPHAEYIGIGLSCEHSERSSARKLDSNQSQLSVSFPNLHADTYMGRVVVVLESGDEQFYEREIFVSN